MRERVEQVVGFCTDHWKEIGITRYCVTFTCTRSSMLFMIHCLELALGH